MGEAFSLRETPEKVGADGLAAVEGVIGLYHSAKLQRTITWCVGISPTASHLWGAPLEPDVAADEPAAPAHPAAARMSSVCLGAATGSACGGLTRTTTVVVIEA